MPKAGHSKVNRPKQDGYEIALDSQNDDINTVWIRFGKLDSDGNYEWSHTTALEQVSLKKNTKRTIAKVDEDQLPAPPNKCYYQLLCEIDGEHGHPEILLSDPALLI